MSDSVWALGGFLVAAVLLGPALLRRYYRPVPAGEGETAMPRSERAYPWIRLAAALAATLFLAARPAYGLLGYAWIGAAFVAGLLLCDWFFPRLPLIVRLGGAVMGGFVVATWVTFLLALALHLVSDEAVLIAGILWIWGVAAAAWRLRWRPGRDLVAFNRTEWVVLGLALLFTAWFEDNALTYDPRRDEVLVSNDSWSDFALHFSFARSFSFGENLPPQYVYYAGPTASYHFGFDFLVGVLERLGLRLDLAFNIPAVLAFTVILMLLFDTGRYIAGRAFAGIVAALLMLLSNSWAWIDYFRIWEHTPRGFVRDWWSQKDRLHIGPYNPETISSHFTLIPYAFQRQLTVAVAVGLVVVVVLIRWLRDGRRLSDTQAAVLGAVLGLLFPLNGVVFLAAFASTGALLLFFWRVREGIYFGLYAVAVAMPSIVLLRGGESPDFHLGYIIEPFTPLDFLGYWWENFGLMLPLVLVALVLGPGKDRRIILALCAPFMLGHLVQLGRDLSGINHKLFNFWSATIVIYAGVMLARLVYGRLPWPRARLAGPLAAVVLLPVLTFSGFIDLAIQKNEKHVTIIGPDRPAIAWIATNTEPRAVFLTTPYFYQPPSGAGRLQYLGWPPFPDSAGYDVRTREEMVRRIYQEPNRDLACVLLLREGIDYVQIGPTETHPGNRFPVNEAAWDGVPSVYDSQGPFGRLRYFRVADIC